MTSRRDRELGMDRPITRRDFVHGAGALALSFGVGGRLGAATGSEEKAPHDSYPPRRSGLRGSHPGSFETAHALALEGQGDWGPVHDTGEPTYDLVVVGAGLSGLAAAHFYRQRHADSRILILDNHDDFGGHAQRNEFQVSGRTLLAHGGSQTLQEPSLYSAESRRLLDEIGIDLKHFETAFHHDLFRQHGLAASVYFDRETYGVDRVVRYADEMVQAFLPVSLDAPTTLEAIASFPLEETARQQLRSLYSGAAAQAYPDWSRLPLVTMSYRDLLARLGLDHPQTLEFFDGMPTPLFCVGIDAVPAAYAIAIGLPGPAGPAGAGLSEPYIHHFPDGNASVARLLVRGLIPEALPGSTMQDVVTSVARYGELDRDGRPARLRLESTVIHVAHDGDAATADEVEVVYVRRGRAERVRARHCVLACYNMIVPHICPDVPEEQKAALARLVKKPLVYTNVALRNWRSFLKLGIAAAYCPGRWHHFAYLDFPVSLGKYAYPAGPDEPVVVHMDWEPRAPGQPPEDQYREGRHKLLMTELEEIEREVRTHLAGLLGGGGFDPAEDIVGLTVNRWPHGYAPESGPLLPADSPQVIGRRPVGRIAIANSDASGRAYADAAFDQAWRAVSELPS